MAVLRLLCCTLVAFVVTTPAFSQRGHGELFEVAPSGAVDAQVRTSKAALKTAGGGAFGRLFGNLLPPLVSDPRDLESLGGMLTEPPGLGDSQVPAIYTYFGQFVDHDITFDPTPLSVTVGAPDLGRNARDPQLSLDSLYGAGPAAAPYLYDRDIPGALALGSTSGGAAEDLLRVTPSGLAVIGDPRNDENLIVAQMHLAFQKAHNRILKAIAASSGSTAQPPFELARQSLVWHYQWIVLNDFLPRIADDAVLNRVRLVGPAFFNVDDPSMPVEFSVAAYRFGHSMVRSLYNYNGSFEGATLAQLFEFTGGGPAGLTPIPDIWIIDWSRFTAPSPLNFARRLDPYVVTPLTSLPPFPDGSSPNLAVRNLLRGLQNGLPSGQRVAELLGVEPLDPASFAGGPESTLVAEKGFDVETPLWYYVLKEAQVDGGGEGLGKVGSTILAETFVGILLADEESYLKVSPRWRPTLRLADGTRVDTLSALIRYSRGE